jgi:hypothetical protein
MIGKA